MGAPALVGVCHTPLAVASMECSLQSQTTRKTIYRTIVLYTCMFGWEENRTPFALGHDPWDNLQSFDTATSMY